MAACQNCSAEINDGFRLCADCRRDYARHLHMLRLNMEELQRQARREIRIEAHGGGGKGMAPSLIDMGRQDLLDECAERIRDIGSHSDCYGDWRHCLRRMITKGRMLAQCRTAGEDYQSVMALNRRITARTERSNAKPFAGICPFCLDAVEADPGQRFAQCRCGMIVDVDKLRSAMLDKYKRLHVSKTMAETAKFIQDMTGLHVTRKDLGNWIKRGKLPCAQYIDDRSVYRFRLDYLMRCAESKSKRQ